MASTNDHGTPDPQVEPRSTAPRRYSAAYKAKILAEYETLGKQAKGALPRREGKRGPYRSGRGRRKRTRATGTSSAAYFT